MPGKTPELRRAYDAARVRLERLNLRFTDEEVQRIQDAAAGAGQSVGAFVLSCVAGRPRPIVDLADAAKLEDAVSSLYAAPEAVSALEADLGRLSGRLSHFFEINYARASEHREEIHATLNEVRELLRTIPPAIAELKKKAEAPAEEIARLVRGIVRALNE